MMFKLIFLFCIFISTSITACMIVYKMDDGVEADILARMHRENAEFLLCDYDSSTFSKVVPLEKEIRKNDSSIMMSIDCVWPAFYEASTETNDYRILNSIIDSIVDTYLVWAIDVRSRRNRFWDYAILIVDYKIYELNERFVSINFYVEVQGFMIHDYTICNSITYDAKLKKLVNLSKEIKNNETFIELVNKYLNNPECQLHIDSVIPDPLVTDTAVVFCFDNYNLDRICGIRHVPISHEQMTLLLTKKGVMIFQDLIR